ncbi:MAG: carboxy terminal-processing peptidase [Gammaproteobacteria bacterium]|nr:carboxy terminal-processing peptidase [Gammaproteobacteria bacterium]
MKAVSLLKVLGLALLSLGPLAETRAGDEPELGRMPVPALAPQAYHKQENRYITALLTLYHYKKPVLNDEFSAQVFDNYVDSLDPSKSYFLAEDLRSFEAYRQRLDEALGEGDLVPAYAIHNRFISRWLERYDYALGQLNKPMDFTVDESLVVDREDASWPANVNELNELWRKRVKNDALNLKLAGKSSTEIQDLLRKRYQTAKKQMLQTKSEDVFGRYMNAFASSVEPHTNYFSPRNAENFEIEMKLSVEGIGAMLSTEDVYTKVVYLVTAGPADKSKQLAQDDRIIGVAQGDSPITDVIGWRLDDVVALIRGAAGSKVRLEVLPAASGVDGKSKIVTLMREKVKLEDEAAKARVVEVSDKGRTQRIGVIKLPKFYIDFAARYQGDPNYRSTTRDVRKLLDELKAKKVDGVIMDLRNNGGGALVEAAELTGLFIGKGPVVQERFARDKRMIHGSNESDVVYDGPMAVLVNRFSASASEIFAGAIQDYGRGLIIGEKTYGKGTVQQIKDLNEALRGDRDNQYGQVKFTVAKFYRVNGGSTQHKGVVPDIGLPSLFEIDEFGESAEKNALPWDRISATDYNEVGMLGDVLPTLQDRHVRRIQTDREFAFLKEDIATYRAQKAEKSVSLNEGKRRQQRSDDDAKALKRENARRAAKRLPPLKSVEEIAKKGRDQDNDDDAWLNESAHILLDFSSLKSNTKHVATLGAEKKEPN